VNAHPAKFSAVLLPVLAELLKPERDPILDPMAGVGTLAWFLGEERFVWSNELEYEWLDRCPAPRSRQDARNLPASWAGVFGVICTSPAYGNRMADRYAGDPKGSRRHTYRIALGRDLHPSNGGGYQWGETYRELHREIWSECVRVLRPGGRFVLNVSDHIRGGKTMPVSRWHLETLQGLGLSVEETVAVPTPRNRHGANSGLRVDCEWVFALRKHS